MPRAWTAIVLLGLSAVLPLRAAAAPPLSEIHFLVDITGGIEQPLLLPSDVAVTDDGRSYVVDSGHHRVAVFTADGRPAFHFGRLGSGAGELRDPLGIALDGRGRVYVADAGNQRIQVFEADGRFLRSIPTRTAAGPVRPTDVALNAAGDRLYVSDSTHHQILALNMDGALHAAWGKEGTSLGEFRYPATMIFHGKLLYVVDVLNTRAQILDERGEFHYQLGEWGVLPGQLFRPKGIAVDRQGRFYVSDSYMDLIEVFDSGYRFAHVLGRGGRIAKFTAPAGIAIDRRDRLFVTEMLGNKVSVYGLR